mgnify:CR=1 FL=1
MSGAAPSARGLFRATGKVAKAARPREALDFYPTPPEVTRALLAAEGARLAEIGTVWEPACGDGAMSRELAAAGLRVVSSDIADRGYPCAVRGFYDYAAPPARAIVTNPPYDQINARDGKGRWLAHAMALDVDYLALFLNWDWPAAAGLAGLLARWPISRAWLCRWKVDFTGAGAPPQRNGWFVWDKSWEGETALRFLERADARQAVLL